MSGGRATRAELAAQNEDLRGALEEVRDVLDEALGDDAEDAENDDTDEEEEIA
jgi:hypothetical protein